jgi:hypothetical protein
MKLAQMQVSRDFLQRRLAVEIASDEIDGIGNAVIVCHEKKPSMYWINHRDRYREYLMSGLWYMLCGIVPSQITDDIGARL